MRILFSLLFLVALEMYGTVHGVWESVVGASPNPWYVVWFVYWFVVAGVQDLREAFGSRKSRGES